MAGKGKVAEAANKAPPVTTGGLDVELMSAVEDERLGCLVPPSLRLFAMVTFNVSHNQHLVTVRPGEVTDPELIETLRASFDPNFLEWLP